MENNPTIFFKIKNMIDRFKRQIEHFGEDQKYYAFIIENKTHSLIEIGVDEFDNYEIDHELDYPDCIIPNIKKK
jgi:hypothetical protein